MARVDMNAPLALQGADADLEAGRVANAAKRRKIVLWSVVSFVAVMVVGISIWVSPIVPNTAQDNINSATLDLTSAVMSNPTSNEVRIASSVVIGNAGSIGATMHKFKASVAFQGRQFGTLDFPEVQIAGGKSTTINMDSAMTITDTDVFRSATMMIMNGSSVAWQITGKPSVSAVGRTMTLNLDKMMTLPGLPLQNLSMSNVNIVSGTRDELYCNGDNTFSSDSAVQIQDFGAQKFLVHMLPEDGTSTGIALGYCTIANFQVKKGFNVLEGVEVVMVRDANNEAVIANFISNMAAGVDQQVTIFGPVNSSFPYLEGVTTQTVLVKGFPSGIAVNASLTPDDLVLGYDPTTGKHCGPEDLMCMNTVMHGTFQVLQNFMNSPINLTNISINVNSEIEFAYNVSVAIEIPGMPPFIAPQTCASGTKLANVYSAPGMWAPFDAARAKEDSVTLKPRSAFQPQGFTEIFLPGRPQVGQPPSGDPSDCTQAVELLFPYDCCFLSIFTAAVCYYSDKGMDHIPVNLDGNATLVVGDFVIEIPMIQKKVPAFFRDDMKVLNFYNLSTFNCANISYAM